MAEKKVKFRNLRIDSLHTFKMRAWSLGGVGDWTDDFSVRTSAILPIQWPSTAVIVAKPLFFFRSIRVTWTPLLGYPLRFSHYVLFRKDTTESEGYSDPTNAELLRSGQDIVNGNLENNLYFLKETGKFPLYTDQVKLDAGDSTDTGVLEEHQYHYWVWAVDVNGQTSYMSSMGQGYLGPNNAEFGIPSTPIIYPDRMETEVLVRNSWWCNVKVVWECVDGAEGYWIQWKEEAAWFWSLPFWVEHDPSKATEEFPHQQWVVLNNFLCDTEYNFKIRAVNVPLFLVSGWSVIETYETEKDPYPPNEIMNVSANRLRQGELFTPKGEYIKLTWDWPVGAVMLQQIEYFRVYKYAGSINQAETYVHYLNLLEGHNLKPDAYSETKQFGGTLFVDDEIKELEDVEEEGATQSFFWNGEYGEGSADDKITAYIDEDLNTEIGVLTTSAYIDGEFVYDGDYSLQCEVGSGTLHWSNCDLDGDEGYLSLRWYPIDVIHTQNWLRIFHAHAGNVKDRLLIEMRVGKLWVSHIGDEIEKEVEHTKTWTSGDCNKWHHIETRWKVSDNTLQVRVDGGSWVTSADPDALTSFNQTVRYFQLGISAVNPGANTEQRYDKLIISPNFVDLVPAYYHYWVTAVDEGGLESVATMPGVTINKPSDEDVHGEEGTGESYDRVSFSPPAAPVLVTPLTSTDAGFNMILILLWKLFTVKMTWYEVSEATYYRVKIRIQPPGRDWGPWMYTARIDEAHANAGEDNPFYVYPFPLRKDTCIEWAAIAGNMAGETESDTTGSITILKDTEEPSKPSTPVGRCYGIRALWGPKPYLWMVVVLEWKPNANYQGVEKYIIFEDDVEVGTVMHHELVAYFNAHEFFYRFGTEATALSTGTHVYKIRAIDGDGNESEVSGSVTVTWQEWWRL